MSASEYESNVGILRRFNPEKYKLTVMNCCRKPGFEADKPHFTAKGEAGNDNKLETSLSRTKRTISEIAECNAWSLFCTFTLDKRKYNRTDLKKFRKDFSQFIRDYRKKSSCDVKYILIPERHKDGCWHMHGLIQNLPVEKLTEFKSSDRLPKKILNRISHGKRVFTWQPYADKFGFADIELIENQEASARYITKYVTKDTFDTARELNEHLFYAPKGLKRAEVIKRGTVAKAIEKPDFTNDFATIKQFRKAEDAFPYFLDTCGEFDDLDICRFAGQTAEIPKEVVIC